LTQQPLRLEDGSGGSSDEIEYGVLAGESTAYPVIAGIPILLEGQQDLVDRVRAGQRGEAVTVAAFGGLPQSGLGRLADVVAGLRPTRRLGQVLAEWTRDQAVRRGREALLPGRLDAIGGLRYAYLESPGRSQEAYNYFTYRFGLPRHFVGLAFLEATASDRGDVLDLGCGAGHLTWGVRTRWPARTVVACDTVFLLLLVARSFVPDVDFVCADATALPFDDRRFGFVFSSDVFSFITRKATAAREAERVLDDGGELCVTSVINALQRHTFAGEPLSPEGWSRLFDDLDHYLLPDPAVLANYLQRRGLPSPAEVSREDLHAARVVSLRGAKGQPVDSASLALDGWPHARGVLGVNPLFVADPVADPGEVRYRRQFPSEGFAADNPDLRTYLPEAFAMRRDDVAAVQQGRVPAAVEGLVGCGAVLGFPPGYLDDPWPGT
jgi:SAM-dependent methyltransferase